jgi:membrane-bound acyltransferase YfiQ involved in biofilm formation
LFVVSVELVRESVDLLVVQCEETASQKVSFDLTSNECMMRTVIFIFVLKFIRTNETKRGSQSQMSRSTITRK